MLDTPELLTQSNFSAWLDKARMEATTTTSVNARRRFYKLGYSHGLGNDTPLSDNQLDAHHPTLVEHYITGFRDGEREAGAFHKVHHKLTQKELFS